jgi:hypothetical protein
MGMALGPYDPTRSTMPIWAEPAKERARLLADEEAWLNYHGFYGEPRNRHERRARARLLKQLRKRAR